MDPNWSPPPRDPSVPGFYVRAEVVPLERQLKLGRVVGFTLRCDEAVRPDGGGGDGTAPSPLSYFTTAIGF
jgi:hypothetical protein